jgi:hypothetical protein
LRSLRGSIEERMVALSEEILGAPIPGGIQEAYTLIYLWRLFLLGGGRMARREDLHWSIFFEDSLSGELQHIFRVVCNGFSIKASSS